MKTLVSAHTICLALLLLFIVRGASAGPAAVAMPDRYAAAAAEKILREGGNAVDAAVTAVFVLAVTYPEAGNIGGGGFMLSYMDGEANFLDFRERAPAKADRDMFLDEQGNIIPGASLVGGRASGVPGTVRGMLAAHERYGSLPWKHLLQPAIELAGGGFTVPPMLARYARERGAELAGVTNFNHYFGHLQTGQEFKQAELAATLELIARDPDSFYMGSIARQIVAQMARSDGLITLQDLATYKALWRDPLLGSWRGYRLLTAPPPSSGGVALIQLLSLYDLSGPEFEGVPHNSGQYVHLLAEIEKRVFADRAEYLGDSDYVEVPLRQLLNTDYLARRAGDINPGAISPAAKVTPGLESPDTTHLSVLDAHGNAVSLSYTLNWDFGSGVVVEGAGFLLNNQMDDFSAKPGVKNLFGVVGGGRNAIAPGKRMLSSMTPTILVKDKRPALVIGSPGGSTIFTSLLQVILNLYEYAMPLPEAVEATRFHHQLPDALLVRHDERDIPVETRRSLQAMGYEVEPNSWGDLGDVQAIRFDGEEAEAVSDSRGRGEARLILH